MVIKNSEAGESSSSSSSKAKFIANDKSRRTTFAYRKNSLLKKIAQLSILCGIDVCAIIYPRDGDGRCGAGKTGIVWPEDEAKIRELISLYKAKAAGRRDASSGEGAASSSTSSDENKEDKQGCSEYDVLSVAQRDELLRLLDQRIAAVDRKIEFMTRSHEMQSPPEAAAGESSCRCGREVHCCCRGCNVVDPQCSHHRLDISLHGTCILCSDLFMHSDQEMQTDDLPRM